MKRGASSREKKEERKDGRSFFFGFSVLGFKEGKKGNWWFWVLGFSKQGKSREDWMSDFGDVGKKTALAMEDRG